MNSIAKEISKELKTKLPGTIDNIKSTHSIKKISIYIYQVGLLKKFKFFLN